MKRAFVTGGSGYLGGVLIQRLVSDGVDVVALARSPASVEAVRKLNATPCLGDLDEASALEAGLRGCDTVFHAAAHFTEWDDHDTFYRANVTGTSSLLDAARSAGVATFVAAGAAGAVMGRPEPLSRIGESTPLHKPRWAPYTATKAEAQQRVLEANAPSLRTVVVSPPMIWGRDMPMLDEMLPLIRSGRFALPDGGGYLVSTCHVDNVVEAMMLAAKRGRGGEVYFVADEDDITLAQVIADLLATRGLPPVERSAPFAMVWTAATIVESIWAAFRVKRKPPLTRQMLRMIGKEFTLDTTKAREELGYRPVITRQAGLADMRTTKRTP